MRNGLGIVHFAAAGAALFLPQASFAYIDPGTGSLLIQWIFGMVVAGFALANLYWHRFKQFLAGKVARPERKDVGAESDEPRSD